MMFKNLTDNAKNLAANAKIEDMSKLFKNHMAGKPDVKNALSGVMVTNHNISFSFFFSFPYFLIRVSFSFFSFFSVYLAIIFFHSITKRFFFFRRVTL